MIRETAIAIAYRSGEGNKAEKAKSLLERANELAWSTIGVPGPCFWPSVSPEMVKEKYISHNRQLESELEQAFSLFLKAKCMVSPYIWGKLLEEVFTSEEGCWCGHSAFNNLI